MVFNLNITSPRRHIQPVADITYPAENVESKKEAPSKKGRGASFSVSSRNAPSDEIEMILFESSILRRSKVG